MSIIGGILKRMIEFTKHRIFTTVAMTVLLLFSITACSNDDDSKSTDSLKQVLKGMIEIDGSSTVFPVSEAVAEEFHKVHARVNVNVGLSGTGGGFKRFTAGETDISNASRPFKEKEAYAA